MSDCGGDYGGGDCGGSYDGGVTDYIGWQSATFTSSSTNDYNRARRTRAEKLAAKRLKRERKAQAAQAKAMEKAQRTLENSRTKPPTLKPEKTEIHMWNGGIAIIEKKTKQRTKRGCVIA
ncbi:hypothetical protein F-E9_347 [Faustovirus]|nr:hypothetical protein F-E9_347 [Faustovirus]